MSICWCWERSRWHQRNGHLPIVKRKDEAAHGEYRTRRVILEIYDAMQQAIETGQPYQTLLDPPPADPRVGHPPRNESDVLARM